MSDEQQNDRLEYLKNKFTHFINASVLTRVNDFDSEQFIPREYFKKLARIGLLGAAIPTIWGGNAYNYVELGLIHELLGKGLASIQNIITVFGMVIKPIVKYGNNAQKNKWLPSIACGDTLVSIALTEENIGCDLRNIELKAEQKNDTVILSGKKKYITLGQLADLFLVYAKSNDSDLVLLVERNTPGLTITPITDLLGLRANMLAILNFNQCKVSTDNIIGKPGYGLTQIIATALDEGRFTTACGCVGLAQAALEEAREYAEERSQFGVLLKEHQLIQQILSSAIADIKAARALCQSVARLRDEKDIHYISETLVAKYFSAKMATTVTGSIMQVFGASGFTKKYQIERYTRDAKIMEVIEGTRQLFETNIAKICP